MQTGYSQQLVWPRPKQPYYPAIVSIPDPYTTDKFPRPVKYTHTEVVAGAKVRLFVEMLHMQLQPESFPSPQVVRFVFPLGAEERRQQGVFGIGWIVLPGPFDPALVPDVTQKQVYELDRWYTNHSVGISWISVITLPVYDPVTFPRPVRMMRISEVGGASGRFAPPAGWIKNIPPPPPVVGAPFYQPVPRPRRR